VCASSRDSSIKSPAAHNCLLKCPPALLSIKLLPQGSGSALKAAINTVYAASGR